MRTVIWRTDLSHLSITLSLPHNERARGSKVLFPVAEIGEIPHSVDNVVSLWYHRLITSPSGREKVDRWLMATLGAYCLLAENDTLTRNDRVSSRGNLC